MPRMYPNVDRMRSTPPPSSVTSHRARTTSASSDSFSDVSSVNTSLLAAADATVHTQTSPGTPKGSQDISPPAEFPNRVLPRYLNLSCQVPAPDPTRITPTM